MRFCFSMRVNRSLPAGGGAKFALDFEEYLINNGHNVEYKIDINNLPDFIVMFDYKSYKDSSIDKWLTYDHIKQLKEIKPDVKVIHRINDIGPPKNRPHDYVKRMCELGNLSDHVIYISNFVKEYYKDKIHTSSSVIYNGVNEEIFYTKEYNETKKIRLITHHWSPDLLKGWDIYKEIDNWISSQPHLEFTFIGNKPPSVELRNTNVISPKTGQELANIIRDHDIYVTASRHEPCGMHHLEGISCGLPFLYHTDGGGIVDMHKFGLGFQTFEQFKEQLKIMIEIRTVFFYIIENEFDKTVKNICKEYLDVFKGIYATRN